MSESPLIYSQPEYYDIAFGRNLDSEIGFFRHCFELYGSVKVQHILEPASGSGMFLAELPRHGFRVTGYDLSPESVQYARSRLDQTPYRDQVILLEGDMRDMVSNPPLDAAINSNNTISHCLTDEDLVRHFRVTSKSLQPGAVYVVDISCAHESPESENLVGDTWTMERDGIQITGTWRVTGYDRERKIRHIDSHFQVNHRGKPVSFSEKHQLRLWYATDMIRLAGLGGFTVAAAYNQDYERIVDVPGIRGEIGNIFFVLVNKPQS